VLATGLVLASPFAVTSSRLHQQLSARWPSLRDAWPGVSLDFDVFCRHVAERLCRHEDTTDGASTALRLDELYLACACERGDAQALTRFEAHYFPSVVGALARLRLGAADVDELKQRLRRHLFVAEYGRRARIAAFAGRGALVAWLRVIAVRLALRKRRRQAAEVPLDDDRLSAADADAELWHLKRHYRPLFRVAFAAAVSALDARDRRLLRQYYVDALTIEQIGAAHGAHRVTVARWLDATRQRLLDHMRRALMRRVRVSQGECDSILRLLHSQLELTLGQLVCSAD
jgi:RNA polymerase sigma-70 factor, ECF subfamily